MLSGRFIPLCLGLLLTVGVLGSNAHAQPGALDPSFGDGGYVFGDSTASFSSVAVQSDGRVLIGGMRTPRLRPTTLEGLAAIWRYLPDGQLDASFGTEGVASGMPVGEAKRYATLIAGHGGEVFAASNFGSLGAVSDLIRFGSDGVFDPTFGGDGVVTQSGWVGSMAIGSLGRVWSFSWYWQDTEYSACSIRSHTPGGTLVGTISPDFEELLDETFVYEQCRGGALSSDGRPMLFFHASDWVSDSYAGIVRYTPDGSLDASYGEGGVALVTVGFTRLWDGVAHANGSVTLSGNVNPNNSPVLARFTPSGLPDLTFGVNGVALLPFGTAEVRRIAVQSNGTAIAVGRLIDRVFVGRFLNDGSLDASFGEGGITLLELGPIASRNYAIDVALDAQERVYVVASTLGEDPQGSTSFVARLLNDGTVAAEPSIEAGRGVLSTPAPNPTSERTTLAYTLGAPTPVRLAIYDVLGREVAVVSDDIKPVGQHEVTLDASRLAPGLYVARLTAGDEVATRRFTVVR